MPAACTRLAVRRPFQNHDMVRLRTGVIPQQMEDKWFIFWEDDALHFHRSWTGICLYILRFQPDGDVWSAIECTVNRNPKEYRGTDDQHDLLMLSYLIDTLLLGRYAPFPSTQPNAELALLEEWHIVGRAMLQNRERSPD